MTASDRARALVAAADLDGRPPVPKALRAEWVALKAAVLELVDALDASEAEGKLLHRDFVELHACWSNAADGYAADIQRLNTERDAARAEVERLREALERYGRHADSCPWWTVIALSTVEGASRLPCACGYAALAEPAGRKEGA